ncbi:MAG: hypothetical protein IJZ20_01940, partial [Clostridia bacterium]|nr:hypothetical protein [Clostridia bacterium]
KVEGFENVYRDISLGALREWLEPALRDFQARLEWCVTPTYEEANHAPIIEVEEGLDRVVKSGEEVILTAVVYPDFTAYEKNADINDIAADIKKKVADINKVLPSFKQIRNIEIRKTEFEKTTTRKIKRFLVK